jgi:hypothetical protein
MTRLHRGRAVSNERLRAALGLIVAYALLVAAHLLFTRQMLFPTRFYDELGYLLEARYFARVGSIVDIPHSGFPQFGYSLLITPAFWMSRDFPTIYQLVLTLNAFVLSAMLFPLVWLARRLIGLRLRNSILCAFTVCLYPAFLLYSTGALSENLFVPLFLLTVVACARFAERRSSYARALAFGLLSGALYMVHGPGLAVVAAVLTLSLVGACVEPRAMGTLAASAASAIVTCFLVNEADKPLLAAMYTDFPSYLPSLRHFYGIPSTYVTAFVFTLGHVFCTNVSTFGLMACGIAYAWWQLVASLRTTKSPAAVAPVATTIGFVLLSFGMTLLVGASFAAVWTGTPNGLDPPAALNNLQSLVGGRYVEGVFAPLVLFGMGALFEKRTRVLALCVSISLGLTLVVGALTSYRVEKIHQTIAAPRMNWDCWTLLGFLRALHTTSFAVVAVVSVCGLLSIYAASRFRRPVPALIALSAAWMFLALTEYRADYLGEQARRWGNAHSAARLVPALQSLSVDAVSYDMATWDPYYYSTYILFDAGRRYETFVSSSGESPRSGAVVAGEKWRPSQPGFERLVCEDLADNCLWLRHHAAGR